MKLKAAYTIYTYEMGNNNFKKQKLYCNTDLGPTVQGLKRLKHIHKIQVLNSKLDIIETFERRSDGFWCS